MSEALHDQPRTHAHRKGARRVSFVVAGLVIAWFLLMRQFGGADIYSVLGPYALSVVIVLWLLRPRALARWLTPTVPAVVVGIGVGVAMTLATYPVYAFASRVVPELDTYVQALYRSADTAPLHVALAWVVVMILAEELLWRGFLLDTLERKLSPTLACLSCVAIYAIAQLGSGAWVVGLLALACGLVWTLERKWTDSLVAPLLSHLIWTPTVILLHPVT